MKQKTDEKISNWERVTQILTIVIALVAAIFSYQAVDSSKKIAKEQIDFSKYINDLNIKNGRPILSATGGIKIFNDSIYNLNITLKNIGERPLTNLKINYYSIDDISSRSIKYKSEYEIANQVDKGFDQTFIERLPRTKSSRMLYFKFSLYYRDFLLDTTYIQHFYYMIPKEQQVYLDKKKFSTVGLFSAELKDKELINKCLKQ
jgi:hypothetical protein